MKSLSEKINENFYKNTKTDVRLFDYYLPTDGFQFGWSAGISDKDWFSMFDMNFLRNYYNKYFDLERMLKDADNRGHWSIRQRYPRYCKGEDYYHSAEAALMFAVSSAHCITPDEKAIREALSKFFNKENDSAKDTEIKIMKGRTWLKDVDEWDVYISNPRLCPHLTRPLYITLTSKADLKRHFSK